MQTQENSRGVGSRLVELVVAFGLFVVGVVVIVDSQRLGAGWADDGPQAGYFPFYLGLLICAASVINFIQALRTRAEQDRVFVRADEFKLVLSVFLPTLAYVGLIAWLGIYVASTLFIGFFMRWLGRYGWPMLIAVSVGVSVVFFCVFELWFKVPLPKGPLELWIGLS
jgi:hypothetical protein